MQVGIIAHPIQTTNDGLEHVRMGLIDYKAHTFEWEQVTIEWERSPSHNAFSRPVILSVSTNVTTMASTGKILAAIARIKAEKAELFDDPANLLHVLQKQLGRHVVWDHRQGEWVKVASLKQESEGRRWEADSLDITVEAESEDAAVAKIIRKLSEKAVQDEKTATDLSQFILNKSVTELAGVDGEPPEYAELNVFSRRNAKKNSKKTSKEETSTEE